MNHWPETWQIIKLLLDFYKILNLCVKRWKYILLLYNIRRKARLIPINRHNIRVLTAITFIADSYIIFTSCNVIASLIHMDTLPTVSTKIFFVRAANWTLTYFRHKSESWCWGTKEISVRSYYCINISCLEWRISKYNSYRKGNRYCGFHRLP